MNRDECRRYQQRSLQGIGAEVPPCSDCDTHHAIRRECAPRSAWSSAIGAVLRMLGIAVVVAGLMMLIVEWVTR